MEQSLYTAEMATALPIVAMAGSEALPALANLAYTYPEAELALDDFIPATMPGSPPADNLAGFAGYLASRAYDAATSVYSQPDYSGGT